MSLAENISERLSYKFSAAGALTSSALTDPTSDPGASGAQILRFISQNLSLTKAIIDNNEKRSDRMKPLGRHGSKRVQGSIQGLLSPGTYGDFMEAALRGTWAAPITVDQSDLTSLSADNSTSTFTAAAGNPVTLGLRVGHIFRATGLSDADNNSKNFLITGFSGTQNRVIAVYPAPDTMTADTSFSLAVQGATLIQPTSSHVSRKLTIESYMSDIDVAELLLDCRVGGFTVGLNADQNVTIELPIVGRSRNFYSGTNAPFFSSPSAATTRDVCGPVGGVVRANGSNLGVLTALSFGIGLNPQAPAVAFQKFAPEIFLMAAAGTGNISFFMEDATLMETFDDETRIEIIAMFTNAETATADAISFHMPYAQLGSLTKQDDGSGGKIVSGPFEFGPFAGTAGAGVETGLLNICDTTVTP